MICTEATDCRWSGSFTTPQVVSDPHAARDGTAGDSAPVPTWRSCTV